MLKRARLPAVRRIPPAGGCTFAESPDLRATEARIIWRAEFDPAALPVSVEADSIPAGDGIDMSLLAPWIRIATDPAGQEHAALSDGHRHIRLDILAGSLARASGTVLLHYDMWGARTASHRLRTLERFLDLVRTGRFRAPLYPADPAIGKGVQLLRVHDARAAGASQRQIGEALFGKDAVEIGWEGRSDHLRQRVRRMMSSARAMAGGGYRQLMRSR